MVVTSKELEVLKINDTRYSLNLGQRKRGSEIKTNVVIDSDLEIKSLGSTCGCTTPGFTKGSKEVTISYNSNKIGNISQVVTVYFNNGTNVKINVLGYVE